MQRIDLPFQIWNSDILDFRISDLRIKFASTPNVTDWLTIRFTLWM